MSEHSTNQLLQAMQPIDVPVPPLLEQALGYPGEQRFVAFYWSMLDELVWDDGGASGTGHGAFWELYTSHQAVAPHLDGLELGNSRQTAEHYFLLDRPARRVYAGELLPVTRLLSQQYFESGITQEPDYPVMAADERERLEREILQWLDEQ